MSAWTELPNGRWVLRATDRFWYQAAPNGEVILSPLGIKAAQTANLSAARREAMRLYRAGLEQQRRSGERAVMDANAALALLDREAANSHSEPSA